MRLLACRARSFYWRPEQVAGITELSDDAPLLPNELFLQSEADGLQNSVEAIELVPVTVATSAAGFAACLACRAAWPRAAHIRPHVMRRR